MPSPVSSDQELAHGIRTGSEEAWRALYHELGERIFRMIYRMTEDSDLASDLTHDTFVKVFEKGHQFSGRGSIRGWVFRIAQNLTKERLRRDSFRRGKVDEVLAPSTPVGTRTPEVESQMVLRQAMAKLSEDHRTVLLLYDVDGYTHPEIAEMLGIAEGTSKARLSRGRQMLRDLLKHAM